MKKWILFIILLAAFAIQAQDQIVINRDYIPYPDTALIYTPSQNSTDSFPLVILLHGWSGNYRQWSQETDLQLLADKYKFIIACPDGFYDSWYIDNPQKKNVQFEKFFWHDFIPLLLRDYRIDESKIFISGLSMGGHGAMIMFLKHPDFFLSAGSTSGILDLTYFPDRWSIKEGIGSIKDFPDVWKKNSAFHLLQNVVGKNKTIIFDCGAEDFSYAVNKQFYEKCLELKVPATFISQPGTHSHSYWGRSILEHFRFFSELAEKKKN